MSGGFFNYHQYQIEEIADQIDTFEALKAIHRRMAELGSAAREARRKRGLSW
jgi:hypothetical protein